MSDHDRRDAPGRAPAPGISDSKSASPALACAPQSVPALLDSDFGPHQEISEVSRINEDAVLKGLYQEATRQDAASSQSARIQAWKLLGLHLGMFTGKNTRNRGIAYFHFENMARPKTIPETPPDVLEEIVQGRDHGEG